jgi:hypothetical protein
MYIRIALMVGVLVVMALASHTFTPVEAAYEPDQEEES